MKKKETTPKLDRSLISFRSLGREQRRLFGLYALGLCLVFLLAALIAFFAILKGPEKVMVPDLRGMELADAMAQVAPALARHFGAVRPALTGIGVASLASRDTLIEVEALAKLRRHPG